MQRPSFLLIVIAIGINALNSTEANAIEFIEGTLYLHGLTASYSDHEPGDATVKITAGEYQGCILRGLTQKAFELSRILVHTSEMDCYKTNILYRYDVSHWKILDAQDSTIGLKAEHQFPSADTIKIIDQQIQFRKEILEKIPNFREVEQQISEFAKERIGYWQVPKDTALKIFALSEPKLIDSFKYR